MVISEITEEKDEEDYSSFSVEAQKTRIRQMLKNQKYLYNLSSSSSSSSSSSTGASCSGSSHFSHSSRRTSLIELMRGGSCSLRRLFHMEHTTLGTFFHEYSASPLIKPILLWGSSDDELDRDPWAMIRSDVDRIKPNLPRGGFASERSGRSFGDDYDGDGERGKTRVLTESTRSTGLRRNRKLSRKKSFRKLPAGFGLRRWWGVFRLRFRITRRLKIMICGRKF